MITESHEKLAFRLTQILIKLNEDGRVSPDALAEQFQVTSRTIQRDLNDRFGFLDLEKSGGYYVMAPARLGKITLSDVHAFADLAGVQGLFPSLTNEFLRDIFDSRVQSALMVKGQHFEDIDGKKSLSFKQLEQAILGQHSVTFSYHKPEGTKKYVDAQPYKLVNRGGAWYLAAKDGDRLKAFSFNKIDRLLVSDATFVPDTSVAKTLEDEDDIWLNPEKIEVVLKVARDAAPYFQRQKLISNQVIEKELEDGGLIVSCKVAHKNQILPIVRYWLPNITVISPEDFQIELETELKTYLARN